MAQPSGGIVPGTPVAGRPAGSGIWRIRLGSLLIPLAHAAGQNLVTVLGLRFMTDSLTISAGTAGAIFAFVKIYDGFADPTIGAWSDRARTRWGRRLPFLLAGGIAMPLGLALLFGAPSFGSVVLAQIFVTLALLIHATGYTLLTIPGFAMLVESSSDPQERTRLMAWRTYGNALGTLLGSTLPAWLLTRTGPTQPGHLLVAGVVGLVVLLATACAVRLLSSAPRTAPPERAPGPVTHPVAALARQVRLAWSNVPFRVLAIAHMFLLFGTAMGSAALAYFTRIGLKQPDAVLGTYFGLATAAMLVSMTGWVWVSNRFGKKPAYIAALLSFAAVQLSWLAAVPGEPQLLIGARGLLSGLSGAGMILCAYALLSDAVRYDYVTSGERREGSFAGFTTLFDKLASAAAVAALGAFLAAQGYVSSGTGSAAVQGEAARTAILLCVSVFPAIAILGAVVAMAFYRLDGAAVEALEQQSGHGRAPIAAR